MSKYEPLWLWIRENGTASFKLSYAEIEQILGFPVDHAFLNCKKELQVYGFRAGKISLKEKTIAFESIQDEQAERKS